MKKFIINAISYYFYGSHYIVFEGKTFRFKGIRAGIPKKLYFRPLGGIGDYGRYLFVYNTGEVEYVEPGEKPYLIGYKIDENSIASQAEIKLIKIDMGGNNSDGGGNGENGENDGGGNGGNDGGENGIVSKIAKAGFPLLIVLAIVGIGFTMFIKKRKN